MCKYSMLCARTGDVCLYVSTHERGIGRCWFSDCWIAGTPMNKLRLPVLRKKNCCTHEKMMYALKEGSKEGRMNHPLQYRCRCHVACRYGALTSGILDCSSHSFHPYRQAVSTTVPVPFRCVVDSDWCPNEYGNPEIE